MDSPDLAESPSEPAQSAEASGQVYDTLELLSEMGQDFASSLDIHASLLKAVSHITDYVQAEGGALFMLEDEGKSLVCRACVGATEITGLRLASDQGIVGRSVQDNSSEMIRDAQNDPRFYKGVDEQTGFTTLSILCAPMSVKDERIGAIELINKKGGDGLFDENDLNLLQAMSASAALAIHNARMAEALVEQERLARELELAAEIQRSLLPNDEEAVFPVHGINVPARTVSGDFFDFFKLDDGRICFNLGDVSGKGMNAALLMAKTASLFRCLGKTIEQPGRLLARVNAEICETATRGMFVTMVGGVYDPRTGIIRFANAGHEPPLVRSREGEYADFPADAPPLGIFPLPEDDPYYPETELLLDGGCLYIFTDGVTEGYQHDGSELEVDGLKALLNEGAEALVPDRLSSVVNEIAFADAKLRDDVTLLAIDDRMPAGPRFSEAAEDVAEEDFEVGEGEALMCLTISSRADRLKLVRAAVTQAVAICECGEAETRDIVIAVDEALQNVIRHGYENRPDGEIRIEARLAGNRIIFLIRDFAETADVSKIKPRDLDDVKPGGLGTHFIREVMDEVEFMPPPGDGGNLLRMVKRIG